jgi:Methyltransferase domain
VVRQSDDRAAVSSDRDKWNTRFAANAPSFAPHPILADLPPAPRVLELAAGPSGTALALARAGADVTVVDVSDVALAQLGNEARTRGLQLTLVHEDLASWTPTSTYDLVFATRFWAADVFARAAAAVAPGGTLAWETFTLAERRYRPSFSEAFCLGPDDPHLPPDFEILTRRDLDDGTSATRRIVARRQR